MHNIIQKLSIFILCFSFLFLNGCFPLLLGSVAGVAVYKVSKDNSSSKPIAESKPDFPTHEMTESRPLNEIRETLEKEPYKATLVDEITFPAPFDEKKQMHALEYSFNKQYWILFHEEKLISYGMGKAKEAEYYIYTSYYDSLQKEKMIKRADAEKLIYTKFKDLYGSSLHLDEYFTYRIMIGDKVDKGKVEYLEADYLITKKWSEINERIQANQYQQTQLQNQQTQLQLQRNSLKQQLIIARSQQLSQLGQAIGQQQHRRAQQKHWQTQQQHWKTQQLLNRQIVQPKSYVIEPFGHGWIMRQQY